DELIETRDALRRREAELAAGVPVTPHREGEKHLAERLEAVLRAGVEAVEADAAALYLLDEATTELKVRSTWGLPFNRLIAPARSLAGALADLEAMLGHAVVLDEDDAVAWNMPEGFAAGVCIPVSSPTTLLGTLWVFSSEKRDFSPRQTNVLEVVAGRLAADLEREVLMDVGLDGARLQKQIAAAERRQRNELPTIAPMLDDWDLAGDTAQAGQVGGALHDWFSLPDGLMAIAAGRAAEDGLAGAWTANAAKTALRAHAGYHREPEPLLQQINRTLWTGSAGDRHASLLLGLVETATGRVGWASAGWPSILRFSPEGWQSLSRASVGLGEGPEAAFQHHECELQPGEAILICTDSVRDAQDAQGRPFGETGLAAAMQGKLELTAEELVSVVQAALEAHTGGASTGDRSILVLKRR
ncbi:MAG: PP2C family protein-serine/threonine phosphatase, partial [Thermoguttaceae bacterium]